MMIVTAFRLHQPHTYRRSAMKRFFFFTAATLMFGFLGIFNGHAADSMDRKMMKELQTKPGSMAFQTIDGKLLKVEGETYVIEDMNGKEHRLHVSQTTVMLNGPKRPGDRLRAEVSRSGEAISIQ